MTKVLLIVNGYPTKENYANIFIKNQAAALIDAGIEVGVLIIDIRSIRQIRRLGFYKDKSNDLPAWWISFPCCGRRRHPFCRVSGCKRA